MLLFQEELAKPRTKGREDPPVLSRNAEVAAPLVNIYNKENTESSAGIGFAACAGKHYFVIGTKAAFLAYPC